MPLQLMDMAGGALEAGEMVLRLVKCLADVHRPVIDELRKATLAAVNAFQDNVLGSSGEFA
jgi:hypothetical protein